MIGRKVFVVVFVMVSLIVAVGTVGAVDTPLIDGLNQPRGLAYDRDGNLYIADPGIGGELLYGEASEFGEQPSAGATSQLLMITPDGTQTTLLPFLSSAGGAADPAGLMRVQVTDDMIWLLMGAGAPFQPFTDAVIALDRETLRIQHFIDLMPFETLYNPDGSEEINSNAHDFAISGDGTVYIVDAGANTLYTWDETNGLDVLQVWSDNSVPTSLAIAPDGSLYIGFLGAGIAPGAGRVDHIASDSTLIKSYEGLTAVTDVMVANDGRIYAVEMITGFGEQGPELESGAVVRLEDNNSTTTVMDGLYTPYALAQSPDGTIIVSTHSAFSAPNSGNIMVVSTES